MVLAGAGVWGADAADVDGEEQLAYLFVRRPPPPFPVPQSIVTLSEFSKKRCDVFGKIAFECDEDLDCLGGFCKVWANSKSKWLLCFVPPHVNAL